MLRFIDRPESQALEIFLGLILVGIGAVGILSGIDPFEGFFNLLLLEVGGLQFVLPMTFHGRCREWMLGATFATFLFLHSWIPAVAALWCWYRNQLERRCVS